MKRRQLLKVLSASLSLTGEITNPFFQTAFGRESRTRLRHRVRPKDKEWPSASEWEELERALGGRLVKVSSPLDVCRRGPTNQACDELFRELKNPYYIGDEPGLTQTLGWVDAWTFQPSVYAVAATATSDVVAAVAFAKMRNLRLVVKGGGHSYLGGSNAPDSLLIWTRHMNSIDVHDAFIGSGCSASSARPAVSIGAGAIWMHVYAEVTTKHGRYVQGGGCTTVGVAGLVQGGGFGSFSKGFGCAAGSLIEAEIVTADGAIRIANACMNTDLFWSLKGGGGGSFGVVTRMTLETHDLPALFGVVNTSIRAKSDRSFRRLIAMVIQLYQEKLFNPHWGEQIIFKSNGEVTIQLMFQGIDRHSATDAFQGFFQAVEGAGDEFSFTAKPRIFDFPARYFWDPVFLMKFPNAVKQDGRVGVSADNVYGAGNEGECGQVLHGYESLWMPAALLEPAVQGRLADALYAAAKVWQVSLHFNKGLAGAPQKAIEAAKRTAMNPMASTAFALAILGAEEEPAYPGLNGHEIDVDRGRRDAAAIKLAASRLRSVVPHSASYVSESNYFEERWQESFWGANYNQLLRNKGKFDPDCLFYVHHGVGSEGWSSDGFEQRT